MWLRKIKLHSLSINEINYFELGCSGHSSMDLHLSSIKNFNFTLRVTYSRTPVNKPCDINICILKFYITFFNCLQAQRYEAASTIYGPYTLPIYINQYKTLARHLKYVSSLYLDR